MAEQILIFGEIGDDFGGVTFQSVFDDINSARGDINLLIDSPGGDVADGFAIAGALKKFKRDTGRKITAHIFGTAASIATFIALQADEIIIEPNGRFLIHEPKGALQGNKDDFEKAADQLETITNELVDLYVAKSNLSRKKVLALMDEDRFLTAQEAEKMGFVKVAEEVLKAVAKFDSLKLKNTEMAKENNAALEALAKGMESIKNMLSKAKNVELTLTNGQKIFINSENPTDILNKTVKLIGKDGEVLNESPENGLHDLQDGRGIKVENGEITVVNEIGQMEDMKNKLDKLVEAVASITEAMGTMHKNSETVQAENKQLIDTFSASLKEEIKEINNNMVTSPPVSTAASITNSTGTGTTDAQIIADRPGAKFGWIK